MNLSLELLHPKPHKTVQFDFGLKKKHGNTHNVANTLMQPELHMGSQKRACRRKELLILEMVRNWNTSLLLRKEMGTSGQDGGIGRHTVPPRTAKRRTTTI